MKTILQAFGPGFYKIDQDLIGIDLVYEAKYVHGPGIHLDYSLSDTYTYPIEGWSWYDDEIQARAALGLPPLPEPLSEE